MNIKMGVPWVVLRRKCHGLIYICKQIIGNTVHITGDSGRGGTGPARAGRAQLERQQSSDKRGGFGVLF